MVSALKPVNIVYVEDFKMEFKNLEIVFENATDASQHDKDLFCQMRRCGIGGSESGTLVGVNKYKDIETLIFEKCQTEVTDEERKVGQLPAVRKGADIEPIILNKFAEWSGYKVVKPEAMYRMKEHPQLTVNFDGVVQLPDYDEVYIPVEAKLVTQWGQKFWHTAHEIKEPWGGMEFKVAAKDITKHVTDLADAYGVPPYYFTQVQHQILALGAQYGYLVALFDKDWELHIFKIFRDERTISAIIEKSAEIYKIIQEKRNNE